MSNEEALEIINRFRCDKDIQAIVAHYKRNPELFEAAQNIHEGKDSHLAAHRSNVVASFLKNIGFVPPVRATFGLHEAIEDAVKYLVAANFLAEQGKPILSDEEVWALQAENKTLREFAGNVIKQAQKTHEEQFGEDLMKTRNLGGELHWFDLRFSQADFWDIADLLNDKRNSSEGEKSED